MIERTQIGQLAIAGLLHDIGKFALRAEAGASRSWDDDARQEYGYKHALLSADFVEAYVPRPWRQTILSAVAYHHRPQSANDRIVALADHLSAGERRTSETGDEAQRTTHPRQLLTIFSNVRFPEETTPPADAYLPLRPLRLGRDVLFPGPPLAGDDEVWRRYEQMWEAFTGRAAALHDAHEKGEEIGVYLESLLLLMQQYTWCIPSAYFGARPDISLYDHSRMSGALAAALAAADLDEAAVEQMLSDPHASEQPAATLVGGDISGVQAFIYTITARGATPGLRGRSFYVQMLTEAAARYVLRRLGLPATNVIYAGGGNFYLLAGRDAAAELPAIQGEISRVLMRHHQGDLYLALGGRPLAAKDFYGDRLAAAWEGLHEQLAAQKARRFQELGDDLFRLFAIPEEGGNSDNLCSVCGREHADVKSVDVARIDDEEGEEPSRKCRPCRQYEALGNELRRAHFLALTGVEPAQEEGAKELGVHDAVLAALGMQVDLVEAGEALPEATGGRQTVLALRDDAAPVASGPRRATGRHFLVNVTPVLSEEEAAALRERGVTGQEIEAGNVKPFNVLAGDADGVPRLGVLRMDVDNLGQIFAQGLGEEATLSRVAALSFAVSLFFEGWVERLASDVDGEGEKERLYSIYSGGDDLFFVGSWDAVVELALRIRADLSAYTAGHPGITASAGVVLVPPKYPLYQAAADAGEAEEQAKQLQWWDEDGRREKDAVSFLGLALPWERFGAPDDAPDFTTVVQLQRFLTEGDAQKKQPLIRRLQRMYEQYRQMEEERRRKGYDRNRDGQPQPLWGPYMYRAVYDLNRLADPSGQKEAEKLAGHLQETDFRNVDQIGLAARWAELSLRGDGEQ